MYLDGGDEADGAAERRLTLQEEVEGVWFALGRNLGVVRVEQGGGFASPELVDGARNMLGLNGM